MPEKLYETNNYEKFEIHPFNRSVKKIKNLEKSMRKHGFLGAYPLHVVKNAKSNRFLIKAGHHRFNVARRLALPLKYVVCNDNATIHELEKATIMWTLQDYLMSYVGIGKQTYHDVREYHEQTGISLGNCISMLGGQSANSHNKIEAFKSGTYRIEDTTHAEKVGEISQLLKKQGISFATNSLFIRALSRILWVEELDVGMLKYKLKKHKYMIEKQPNLESYNEMIESIYNRQNHKRIPLSFLADEMAKLRSAAKPSRAVRK